eukprot:scaffold4745_cov67-Phaeocystis_antarctica.AAC.3
MAQRSNFRALLTDRQKPFTHTLTFNRQGKRPDNAHKPVQAQEMAGNGIPDGRTCGIWKELIVIVKYTYFTGSVCCACEHQGTATLQRAGENHNRRHSVIRGNTGYTLTFRET